MTNPIPGILSQTPRRAHCIDCGQPKKSARTNDLHRGIALRCRSCAAKRVHQELRGTTPPPTPKHPP